MKLDGTVLGNIKARLRMQAGCHVRTWQFWQAMRGKPLADPKQIDLVLEGYPRSGNTFAEHMLRIMCPELRWISHTHSTGTLLWAKRHGIPCLILIRDPEEAAVSLYIYQMERISMHICLQEWIQFYQQVQELSNVNIISFQSLVANTEGALTLALRSLGLGTFIHSPLPPNPSASFEASHDHDKWHLREVRGVNFGEEQGNRPTEKRSSLKQGIMQQLLACNDARLATNLKLSKKLAASFQHENNP